MTLQPPSEAGEYSTRQALVDAIQKHALDEGYAVTVRRSCKRDGTIYLGCDYGGKYRPRYGINDTN
jgi:hypothetical protein